MARERRIQGERGGRAPFFFICNHLGFFCGPFEELQTVLFEVELIINNAPLTYVYSNTIETCLTPYHSLADKYYILLTQNQL